MLQGVPSRIHTASFTLAWVCNPNSLFVILQLFYLNVAQNLLCTCRFCVTLPYLSDVTPEFCSVAMFVTVNLQTVLCTYCAGILMACRTGQHICSSDVLVLIAMKHKTKEYFRMVAISLFHILGLRKILPSCTLHTYIHTYIRTCWALRNVFSRYNEATNTMCPRQ
jgi:hypothetical protein